MSAAKAFALMVDPALIPQTRVTASYAPPCETLAAFAKMLGVDAKALRAEFAAEASKAKTQSDAARSTSKKAAKRAA